MPNEPMSDEEIIADLYERGGQAAVDLYAAMTSDLAVRFSDKTISRDPIHTDDVKDALLESFATLEPSGRKLLSPEEHELIGRAKDYLEQLKSRR